jgi:hydrogenase-4 component E
MILGLELVLVVVMLSDLAIIGAGRIDTCIRIAAIQGALLGVLPILLELVGEPGAGHTGEATHAGIFGLLAADGGHGYRVAFLSISSFVIKGIVFPYLLFNSLRAADIRQEVDPLIGYGLSLLVAILLLGLSFWVSNQMKLPEGHPAPSDLALPAAFATTLIGLQLIVSRRRAILQTVGYLVMENGIFIFGVTLAHKQPILVEMGVLLDVFVAVFVMGITIFHISKEFDHQDADQLSELRD